MLKKDYSAKKAMEEGRGGQATDHGLATLGNRETDHVAPIYTAPIKSNEGKGYKYVKTNTDSPILMPVFVPLLFLDVLHNEQHFPMFSN